MIQKILEILHECCVDVYSICETGRETAELFFIKRISICAEKQKPMTS